MSVHGENSGMTEKGKQYKIELYDQSFKLLKQTVTKIKRLIPKKKWERERERERERESWRN